MSLEIIYQDNYCLLVTKPNNVLVHHAHHSRNKIDEVSLIQLIENQFGKRYYPIHRLDRKTSGIILLASKREYVASFQALFTNNEIQKIYYGVVRGFSQEHLIIDSPVKGRDALVYKDAETQLKLLDKIILEIPVKPYKSSRYSLVELKPKTGRMHQLRIHMNKVSTPLINDAKYGDKNHDLMYAEQFGWRNLFLHAGSLEFIHPFTNQKLTLKSSFSEDWIQLFQKFSWKNPLK
ncbi:pseudouridine synthase [Flavobacteriaceae bacterium]|jgi:tRNA pseudouridine65 synthase|nr:pseudouridine synthase [Flavobacteriaceae bacterium]MDB2657884.1 pseudouridine synthase [Flavobacteriaceae bacterium]MDG1160496.1 pseudouridine synthase [Flavobacteriaceae bacterium]MDG1981186.1 pseudouridine synthase [Flavobacteriaceae bacterium]|tara:strand:+ start:1682 stop:2386 length:705 start_codon:yes stop_codon:yes gene_type:complete